MPPGPFTLPWHSPAGVSGHQHSAMASNMVSSMAGLRSISSIAGQQRDQALKLGLLRSGHAEFVIVGRPRTGWRAVQVGEPDPDVEGHAAAGQVAAVHVGRVKQERREQEHRSGRGREPGVRPVPCS